MLHIENLAFAYPKGKALFKDLNLTLEKGNIYGLLGRNGAGKTSLLKLACGLLYPQSGSIHMNELAVSNREPAFLSDIYLIPEEFSLPDFKPEEYIRRYSVFYPRFDASYLEELLKEMEVDYHQALNKMSFGQRKKFMIAFALATRVSLVVMDEPTNGLDIPSKSKFRRIIASAIDEERTFLISTHQVRDLESLIDPLLIIDDGRILVNAGLEKLSQLFSCINTAKGEHPRGEILYREKIFGGEYLLTENPDGTENPIDFELLFNAVLHESAAIINRLNA